MKARANRRRARSGEDFELDVREHLGGRAERVRDHPAFRDAGLARRRGDRDGLEALVSREPRDVHPSPKPVPTIPTRCTVGMRRI